MSTKKLDYCIDPDVPEISPQSSRVVYFFHGIEGGPKDLFQGEVGKALRKLHEMMGSKTPIFISLSVGAHGLVKENEMNELGQRILPAIERKLGLSKNIQRDLIGLSMGAHNAMRMASFEQKYFGSINLLCPALIAFNPYSMEEIQAYIKRHPNLDMELFERVLLLFRKEFATPNEWMKNNPFVLMTEKKYQGVNRIFLSVGLQDTLGFEEGSLAFADLANQSGTHSQLKLVDGVHCAFDSGSFIQSLVD